MTTFVGAPIVIPSTEVMNNWSASACTPASRSTSARRTPSHRAVLISGPPTSLDTQHSVIQRSMSGRRSSCA